MATTPKLQARDGSGYVTNLVFTTNREAIVLTGTVGSDTAAVQVSVNGGPFSTNVNLLRVELGRFTFPNPSSYSSGFVLNPGTNTVAFRAIDVVGGVSSVSVASVTLVFDTALVDAGTIIPTGVKVERRRSEVDILAAMPPSGTGNLNFRGFNFYASTTPAGTTGYYRINESLVLPGSDVYEDTVLQTFETFATWGDPKGKRIRVKVSEEDEFGNELAVRYNEVRDASLFSDRAKVTTRTENYTVRRFAKLTHRRSGGTGLINTEQFAGVEASRPLYYVVTAVFYDVNSASEYESAYSQEVLGAPLSIDTAVLDLPARTQVSIVTDYINAVTRVNAELSLIPGSTTRDVSIDPFASEAERLWFLMDFVHRAQSFVTLLQVDNISGSGTSDPVATSAYKSALKSALGYTNDGAVQSLIDTQFEKLAKNVNRERLTGRFATGQVVFYTTTKPTRDIVIPAGTSVSSTADTANNVAAVSFTTGGTYVLPAASAETYYNYSTKRYEIIADISAVNTGSSGNVPAGAIVSASGVSGVSVVNLEATVGGTDVESNADLAARSILSFASVDTGTESGYYQAAAEQVGIVRTKVVKSGDTLMMRDWDPLRKKHIGGKVDVWVQGVRERQVTEKFAFSFEIARDIRCYLVDPVTLVFRVLDSRVTPTNPILEMLDNAPQGFGVRNATQGLNYDLSGVVLLDYRTFQLNGLVPQPVTAQDDLVYADYRFRSENRFVPSLQPVRRVTSVVGEVSGPLTAALQYNLYRTDDPLLEGESTVASNYVAITQADGKPDGAQVVVNDEPHVLVGFVYEPLDSIGVNVNTLRVFNSARTIEYVLGVDFEVIAGTDRTPPSIVRASSTSIENGQQVSVDYIKDENFTLTYVVNDVLQQLQLVLNARKHVTADVLVKQAVVNSVDLETTVQLKAGATKDKVDPAIRTNVSLDLNRRTIGQGVAQSDVIHAVDATTGVDYEIVPLARMAYADGALILREEVLSSYVHVPSLDSGGQRVYLLTDALNYPTTDNGGLSTEHRGVFQDDEPLVLAESVLTVGSRPQQAYVIGSEGAMIPGYTGLTSNRILVSLPDTSPNPDVPLNHRYTVSYNVRNHTGAHDIYGSDVEAVDLGAFVITYRTA